MFEDILAMLAEKMSFKGLFISSRAFKHILSSLKADGVCQLSVWMIPNQFPSPLGFCAIKGAICRNRPPVKSIFRTNEGWHGTTYPLSAANCSC